MRTHVHHHTEDASRTNEKVVLICLLLTLTFTGVEVIGGLLSGSLALIADAGHMLTDSFALGLAWLGFHFGRKKSNEAKTFGYLRFEILAGFFNALTLLILVGWIVYEAFERMRAPVDIHSKPMMVVAVIGLAVNCLVFSILHKGDKTHVNVKGAMLHVIGDLLGSVAVILAAIIIYFTGWKMIDPILSVLVALLIVRSALSLMKNTIHILMQGTPPEISLSEIEKEIKRKVKEVTAANHIHVWAITSGKYVGTVEVEVKEGADYIEITRQIKSLLKEKFCIGHVTVGMIAEGDHRCTFVDDAHY